MDTRGDPSRSGAEPVAIGFRCSHCNQPLPLRVTGIIACPACGGENYVQLPPGAAPPARSDRAPVLALLGTLGILCAVIGLGVGGVLWVVGHRGRHEPVDADDPDPPAVRHFPWQSGADDIVSWVGSGGSLPPCLADVDGDGALDVIGYATSLTAVSGATGRVLWRDEAMSTESGDLWCDGRGAVVMVKGADFSATRIDPRSGKRAWSVKLPDKPEGVSFGDRCLSVRTSDKSVTTLSLATGAPAPCPSAKAPLPPWEQNRRPVEVGAVSFGFDTVKPGSPRVIVTAMKGGQSTWTRTLAIANDMPLLPPHGLAGSALVLAGQKPGTQEVGVVALDAESGAVVASHDIRQKEFHGTSFLRLTAVGKQVFLETFGKLYALRLPNLEVIWEAGSMW